MSALAAHVWPRPEVLGCRRTNRGLADRREAGREEPGNTGWNGTLIGSSFEWSKGKGGVSGRVPATFCCGVLRSVWTTEVTWQATDRKRLNLAVPPVRLSPPADVSVFPELLSSSEEELALPASSKEIVDRASAVTLHLVRRRNAPHDSKGGVGCMEDELDAAPRPHVLALADALAAETCAPADWANSERRSGVTFLDARRSDRRK